MQSHTRCVLGLVVLMVSSIAACSDPTVPPEDEALPPLIFDCTNPIEILDAPRWPTLLDVIALPTDAVLQRGRFDDDLRRRFSKFGLVIRADQALTITVAEASRPNALIGWNNAPDKPVTTIEIGGCSGLCETDNQNCTPGESGEWIAYPGGVWTTDPACIVIEIETGGRAATAELPIGVECN